MENQLEITKNNRKKEKLFHILEVISFVALTLCLLMLLQALVLPKYMSFPYEGALMGEYYRSEVAHDVIFLGDCEFYESISPVTLWEKYGISSYVRGSPQQLMWHSYYILLDTLKRETPKVVVLNAMEMKIGEVQEEEYTRLTLDGLKDLRYRLEAAEMSLTKEESLVSYAFPLLRYHSRWSQLNSDDINYLFHRDTISYGGYLMQNKIDPQLVNLPAQPLADYTLPEICYEYMDKIRQTCEERGIEFLLFKAPTESWHYPWYDEWDKQLEEYAEKHDILYINGLDYVDEMGLDMKVDTYDKGVHLNVFGAEKCSEFLGKVLKENFSVPDRSNEPQVSSYYGTLKERYDDAKNSKDPNDSET